ncbi:voltage-dependent calcium channel subunit alpha-2/delta-3 [Lutzomyia longipalpis]|uniref:voltage-dependent calcium channel subunit alpha-2/delta-3 n=1 Tax=Lutzomyia longipalpis TaxID=7200 RepID=UPI0024833674|nr:voltage-dependent calcium channel subunit alpha-2/delta-3 [Lutzomyia longipalpis]
MGVMCFRWSRGHCVTLLAILPLLCATLWSPGVLADPGGDVVEQWAQKFGDELWELGQKMTKSQEIQAKYKAYNARVEPKDGESLIQSIVENVGRMFIRKMDAVKCILHVAEEVSEQFEFNETYTGNFTYYSSKYSEIYGKKRTEELPEVVQENSYMYREMYLDQDTHFYNISVNTTHSSVHVPTNVYDRSLRVVEALLWSEALDEVFVQNYNSDPALSWQYFGSYTGILRHYPAMEWEGDDVDVYDCRRRSWYIETATCSKDVVILLDNSGSMTGFRNYIAQLTVKSVLETFSNNDFINIYNYSNTVQELVPCFNDMLVQATPENIQVFNNAVQQLEPEGYANVSRAFVRAFQLLEKYREIRRCNESTTGCNQAIMLITDGVPSNLTEVFDKWNRVEMGNETRTPVRIFTYLLGKEVTKVREIQWMACLNRGYYSHIQTLDQVQEEVLKYVTVIATPLVLQGIEHPPTWTHAFADKSYTQEDDDTPPRLMIAVGVPAFDHEFDPTRNVTRSISLLGVAGTDVPIEDIDKLTLPYKLGVGGYSFIVSNNGYVLLHPDLRPTHKGILKPNYNSIDFTEVEQFDDDKEGREPGEDLLALRENLVNTRPGKMLKIPVRFHYDKMRRVSQEVQDYYFAPLANTPFSLGLALPHDYGNTWIKVGDEIKRNQHMGINISDFFVGENWKVHPDWVYCKYHYLEGHEFKTPEDELRHFLKRLYDPQWTWSQQYEPDIGFDTTMGESTEPNCGRKTLDDDAYYCNKELVQLLIFDAKVTNTSYREWRFEDLSEKEIIQRYNATLRFVATMSGLTRWQFIFGEVEVDTDREFGDYHTTAIDEGWYKSAILQHKIDSQSFVYSVPHASDPPEEGELKVTASHAIFPRDGGLEAPGAVVGFQFSHQLMYERFMELTAKTNCNDCMKSCESDEQDCYVIDNNGYVILSETQNDTGRFFGELEGAVMEAMVEAGIYKSITVYDWQALCFEEVMVSSDSSFLISPLKLLIVTLEWLLTEFVLHLSRMHMWLVEGVPLDDVYDDYDTATVPTQRKLRKGQNQEEEDYFNRPKEIKYETKHYSCDKQSQLYLLNQSMFIQGNGFSGEGPRNCSRPYYIKRIPHSNLVLVVVNTMYSSCYRLLTAEPQVIEYNVEFPCHKLAMNYLPRRRLEECFTEHPDEEEMTYCGHANVLLPPIVILFGGLFLILSIH